MTGANVTRLIRLAAAALLAAPAAAPLAAQTAGETHRTVAHPAAVVRDSARRGELRITIWYPAAASAAAEPLLIGPPGEPFFEAGAAAPGVPVAPPAPGERYPVVLLSHGFGGSARIMGWFGTALARSGYVVISVDHPGNNALDPMTVPGAILPWERAEDLKRAFEVVVRDSVLGPYVDAARVAAAGFSAGGFTALVLGGARANPDRFLEFCRAHPDDGVCAPQVEFTVTEADHRAALADRAVAASYARAGDDHAVPQVRAVLAMAPALVQGIDPASLAAMDLPVRILAGQADAVAPPATNARVAADLIEGAQLTMLPAAGHYAFLAQCTAAGAAAIPVCRDAERQDAVHRATIAEATELFARAFEAAPATAAAPAGEYSRGDTLRGDWTTPGRRWWDVTFYDLHVSVNPADSTIRGRNGIIYRVLGPGRELQIDLMAPLVLDSVLQDGRTLALRREGNAWFAAVPAAADSGQVRTATAYYHGRPTIAERPPWEGGFTWAADSLRRPWVVTTDQGVGASIWWPNKDTQADEPDSQRVALTVPDPLIAVANGRLRSTGPNGDGTTTYEWFVTSPINNYAIAANVGHYTQWSDTLHGERGVLTLDFRPLDIHRDAARRQWQQVKPTIRCLEHWFGPYPWYEDGYKLVEVPYPGMEHQSAVTYGNGFANGYGGRDLSGTGLGMEWDFIIVHESAHEWFANAVTAKDQADMWVHESFANYAEGLYTECLRGKEAGAAYIIGSRRGILNDRPIQPPERGVNAEGSGDMYPKGGNMLHTIRQLVGDDEKWRGILRGLVATFGRRTVLGSEVEAYIARESGLDLAMVFDQYLRDVRIPVLEWRVADDTLHYRWAEVVPGFAMPVDVTLPGGTAAQLRPTGEWQTRPLSGGGAGELGVDPDYYVLAREVAASR